MSQKELTYEEVVEFDIYKAIEMKSAQEDSFSDWKEFSEYLRNHPATIKNNSLLLDYDYVYENVEDLFFGHTFDYQNNQSSEAYYVLFKALTDKYPIEEDYNEYIFEKGDTKRFEFKWHMFCYNLANFISYAFDERIIELFKKEDVLNYFLKYYKAFSLNDFCFIAIEELLKHDEYTNFYYDNPLSIIELIKKNVKLNIPADIMLNEKIVRGISHTYRIEEFYYNLYYISEHCCPQFYIDEHIRFCDEQVSKMKDGILPCYLEKYDFFPDNITKDIGYLYQVPLNRQTFNRVFEKLSLNSIPKKQFFQELSKYMLVGMFMSRNLETSPYNILVDINTLYNFACENNRTLKGFDIYKILMNFESMDIEEVIEYYKKTKNISLKEILYDDWESQKKLFVEEINKNIRDIDDFEIKTDKNGISYYDISEYDGPIIVHNESFTNSKKENFEKLIDNIVNGIVPFISLSIQDGEHQIFFEREGETSSVKFIYGVLEPSQVGIVHYEDAYSTGPDKVEIDNINYIRRLYTLKSFLEKTKSFNEIVYVVDKPFLPVGVLCEDEIKTTDIYISKILNIPLCYRNKKEIKTPTVKPKTLCHYSTNPSTMKFFVHYGK